MPIPEQLKRDLIRTSAKLGFITEMKAYQKAFNMMPTVTARKITASGMTGGSVGSYSDEENDIFIPVPVGVNIGLNDELFQFRKNHNQMIFIK